MGFSSFEQHLSLAFVPSWALPVLWMTSSNLLLGLIGFSPNTFTYYSNAYATKIARAYVRGPNPLSIILCSNRLSSPSEISEVLIHELIHIYDVSRSMDLQQCRQLAYSEVRAARDAECHKSLSTFTRNICAKDKATAATKNMFPDQGRGCVCEVFDRAILDMSPLGPNGNVSSVKPCLNGGGMRSSNLGGSDDNTAPRPSER
jgi:hypothetical protein